MQGFDEYQLEAKRTVSSDTSLAVLALGLAGEAGEVADLIKKHLGHGHSLITSVVAKELGDVLWYIATLADKIGYNLSDVAELNSIKLRMRYPSGFSTAASLNHADEDKTSSLVVPDEV